MSGLESHQEGGLQNDYASSVPESHTLCSPSVCASLVAILLMSRRDSLARHMEGGLGNRSEDSDTSGSRGEHRISPVHHARGCSPPPWFVRPSILIPSRPRQSPAICDSSPNRRLASSPVVLPPRPCLLFAHHLRPAVKSRGGAGKAPSPPPVTFLLSSASNCLALPAFSTSELNRRRGSLPALTRSWIDPTVNFLLPFTGLD